ncbi:MAG TPA: hypothetical protein VKY19_00040 [Ktedonosporobacter sp.]|nr:hypothetical protein [Ktedonosporobacter sp.]
MTRHLETCQQRPRPQSDDKSQQKQRLRRAFHLRVEGRRLPMYWMHLAIDTHATLATLDQFLRDMWLECCGHLSAFEIDGVSYRGEEESQTILSWLKLTRSMRTPLSEILHPGQICAYEYDFGSTTELVIKVIAEENVEARKSPIQILARNTLPFIPCDVCGEAPVAVICWHCLGQDKNWLCHSCAETHPCGKQGLRPQANSPRAGVCGYVGPRSTSRW